MRYLDRARSALLSAALAGGAAAAASGGAHAQGNAVSVPRGAAPTLDARIAPGEWDGAAVVRLADGTELRLQHDARFLYLAIRPVTTGFTSVCVTAGDVVHVLHSSAGLAHAEYQRGGAQWTARRPFTFELRTREDTPAAREERQAFLQQHGWLGTTMYQGDRMQKEMQIALSFIGESNPRIAVAFMRDSPGARTPGATWPARLADACVSPQLVRGFDVGHPDFDPARWVRLHLAG